MAVTAADQWRTFAWQAAALLGVSSSAQPLVTAVVDPEALLALAAQVDDVRLHGIAGSGAAAGTIDQWVATISAHAPSVSWSARHDPIDEFVPSAKSAA